MEIYQFKQIQNNKIFSMIKELEDINQCNFRDINEDCNRLYRKWLDQKVTNVFMLDFLRGM